jgi:hypothetical protein
MSSKQNLVRALAVFVALPLGAFSALVAALVPEGRHPAGIRTEELLRITGGEVTASGYSTVHWTGPRQFDLECSSWRRFFYDQDGQPQRPLAADAFPYREEFRIVVDVPAMKYCLEDCARQGVYSIAEATRERIVFLHSATGLYLYRPSDGSYENRTMFDGRVMVTQARCQQVDFTGFPTRQRRR